MTTKDLFAALYPRLPTPIRQALLTRRRANLWLERGILFIHVPKAAGTSINRALYGRFMGHPRAIDIERWANRKVKALPRFSVTRNPWDRLLSAYRFAKRGNGIGDVIAGVWKPEQYRVPEFETFERFVLEWLPQRNVAKLDFVFRPQWHWLCSDDGRLLVDHVGRLEDMGPTYAFLQRTIAKVPAIPWENRSGDRIEYRKMYTPRMAELVADIYRNDIELLGYDF